MEAIYPQGASRAPPGPLEFRFQLKGVECRWSVSLNIQLFHIWTYLCKLPSHLLRLTGQEFCDSHSFMRSELLSYVLYLRPACHILWHQNLQNYFTLSPEYVHVLITCICCFQKDFRFTGKIYFSPFLFDREIC